MGTWVVALSEEFEPEFDGLDENVQTEILAPSRLLQRFGPALGLFAFDPRRRAILLVAGDKSGVNERRFYRALIHKADGRFDEHLARLKRAEEQGCR
jgi:hypothetical protein